MLHYCKRLLATWAIFQPLPPDKQLGLQRSSHKGCWYQQAPQQRLPALLRYNQHVLPGAIQAKASLDLPNELQRPCYRCTIAYSLLSGRVAPRRTRPRRRERP